MPKPSERAAELLKQFGVDVALVELLESRVQDGCTPHVAWLVLGFGQGILGGGSRAPALETTSRRPVLS